MSAAPIHAGAPPGPGNGDAPTGQGRGVMKMQGEQHFRPEHSTATQARARSYAARRRARCSRRRLRLATGRALDGAEGGAS